MHYTGIRSTTRASAIRPPEHNCRSSARIDNSKYDDTFLLGDSRGLSEFDASEKLIPRVLGLQTDNLKHVQPHRKRSREGARARISPRRRLLSWGTLTMVCLNSYICIDSVIFPNTCSFLLILRINGGQYGDVE